MLRFSKIVTNPRVLYRMTGLTMEQMQELTERFRPLWEKAERERLSSRERTHAIGQGRKYKLDKPEDKLLLVLMFYRYYLCDALLGWMFNLDESNVSRLKGKMEALIECAADPGLKNSIRRSQQGKRKKIKTWEELLEVCPEFAEVMTDATEQIRQRPSKRNQRRWYSGKKKRHTIKTQITINRQGKILLVSPSVPGRVHDYALFGKERTVEKLPPQSSHYLDRGYDGASGDYPAHDLRLPVKKRRNHRVLTLSEKRTNKKHSRIRVLIEHILSRMKKYQILAQVYRHPFEDYNQRFRNIAALTNFRLATA